MALTDGFHRYGSNNFCWPSHLCQLTLTVPVDMPVTSADTMWFSLTDQCKHLKRVTLVAMSGTQASTLKSLLPQSMQPMVRWEELVLQLAGPIPDLSDTGMQIVAANVKQVSLTIGNSEAEDWLNRAWNNVDHVARYASRLRLRLHHPTAFASISAQG